MPPILRSKLPLFLLLVFFCKNSFASDAPESSSPVTVTENANQIVMENGIVSLTFAKRAGEVTSIKYQVAGHDRELGNGRAAMYFDANLGGGVKPDYFLPFSQPDARLSIVPSGPDSGEVAAVGEPTTLFPFHTEVHWVLPRDTPGFYVYVIYRHGPDMAAASLSQSRMVIKGVPGTRIFTHHIVDDQRRGPFPTGKIVGTVQDATFRYADGTINTKYDNSAFIADDLVHGMAGNGVGLWMILPGREYINGGPLRQELTVHMDNVLLWMFQGTHFGGSTINLKANQKWNLFYGPAFIYFNQGGSIDALWQDARIRAVSEETRWPYNFVNNPDYPLSRGTVIGQIKLGNSDSTKGAWAVLAPPGTKDWCQSSGGYTFWTRTDDSGHFVIPKVRPGSYTLFVSGANQFVDYRQDAIQVGPGKIIDLGTLTWKPVTHGHTLWQIGVADRSTREFKNGDDVRHYDNFIRYAREFPDDVTFTIGKSETDKDWNFAQWGWYNKKPHWTIRFDEPKALSGRATLTIGVCSSSDRHLQVKANGREIGVLNLPKTGTAPYRSGGQDSEYHVYTLRFDANWLKAGTNEITLGLEGTVPFANPDEARPARIGAVMYDAIRLEVQE
jgi:rhamnogalacturonan endolyase